MDATENEIVTVLKKQIANSGQALAEMGYDEGFVRARVAHLARRYGGPALDVGTGACACMAVTLARYGLAVTAVDRASNAVRMAQKHVAERWSEMVGVHHADASHLPFLDGSYRVAVAFDMLCHSSDPGAILGEMFRVSSGLVMISELNRAGRRITHHLDEDFDARLPDLLAEHCQDCQRYDDAHHVTYVCKRF